MMSYEIRPATLDDLMDFYGKPPERTVRAWAIEWRGKIAAITGFSLDKHGKMAFMDIAPDINAPAITVWRVSLDVMRILAGRCERFYASTDNNKSKAYLERLGFKPTGYFGQGVEILEYVRI